MAYYGIPSAGQTLTATNGNDKVDIRKLGGTLVTAQSVYGAEGNDIISLGAVGETATASATVIVPTVTFKAGGTGSTISGNYAVSGSVVLSGSSAQYIRSGSTTLSAAGTGGTFNVQISGVITSDKGARTINAALFQANAGNDSIALGSTITRVSASTFAGGAGNDLIGTFNNINDVWTGVSQSATFVGVNFEGGNGNDTISLSGNAVYSALNVNANQGNDLVAMNGVSGMTKSVVGLGAGADTLSGGFVTIDSATIAGGKGADTITLSATTFDNSIIGGDRGNAVNIDGDGNDSIYIEGGTNFTAGSIYGGGGNDTVTFSAAAMTASVVSLNQGKDVFTLNSGALVSDSTIGLGNQGDSFSVIDSGMILSSRINLGKGLDSIYFGGTDVGSGDFANTTIYGGAGADWLIGSATLSGGATVDPVLEYKANTESTLSAFDTIAVELPMLLPVLTSSATSQVHHKLLSQLLV